MREKEKWLKRFDASLEWLSERIAMRDEENEKIRTDDQMEGRAKSEKLNAMKMKSVAEVLKEVEVLIDTHFFNEFSETKSSSFLKVISSQSMFDVNLLNIIWRNLNHSQKTMKVMREIREIILWVGKMKEMSSRSRLRRRTSAAEPGRS